MPAGYTNESRYWNLIWVHKLDTEMSAGYTNSDYTKSILKLHLGTQTRYWNASWVYKRKSILKSHLGTQSRYWDLPGIQTPIAQSRYWNLIWVHKLDTGSPMGTQIPLNYLCTRTEFQYRLCVPTQNFSIVFVYRSCVPRWNFSIDFAYPSGENHTKIPSTVAKCGRYWNLSLCTREMSGWEGTVTWVSIVSTLIGFLENACCWPIGWFGGK